MSTVLATSFATLLEELDLNVHPSGTAATIGEETIEAPSLAELRPKLYTALYAQLHVRNSDLEALGRAAIRPDLLEPLVEAIPHRHVVAVASEASTAVRVAPHLRTILVDDLKVLVDLEQAIQDDRGTIIGVRLPSWRTHTTPGYVLALGQRGIGRGNLVRFYISRSFAGDTLALWSSLLTGLNDAGVAYHAKALSSSSAYPRSDAVVVYTTTTDRFKTLEIVTRVLELGTASGPPMSIFAEEIVPGLAEAAEPMDLRTAYRRLSFGQHRSRVLADAMIRANYEQRTLTSVWDEEARAARIDPHHPGRNLAS